MTPDDMRMACKRAICLFGTEDFEAARDDAYNSALNLVEDGTRRGVDLSQVVLYDLDLYKLRLQVSPYDREVKSRIDAGRAILRQETEKVLVHNPAAVIREIPRLAAYMDCIESFCRFLGRPGSMFEMFDEPPRMVRREIIHPSKFKKKG